MLALQLGSSSVRSVRVDTLYAISKTLRAHTPTPPRWHRGRTDFWAQRGGTPFVRKAIAHERVIWTEKGATKEPSERGAGNPSAQRRCPRSRQLRGPETIKVQSSKRAPSYLYRGVISSGALTFALCCRAAFACAGRPVFSGCALLRADRRRRLPLWQMAIMARCLWSL